MLESGITQFVIYRQHLIQHQEARWTQISASVSDIAEKPPSFDPVDPFTEQQKENKNKCLHKPLRKRITLFREAKRIWNNSCKGDEGG